MKLDKGTSASLSAILAYDVQMIQKWVQEIEILNQATDWQSPDVRDLITQAYHLHNIYNALENSFEQISRSFENHVEDTSQWHKTLLNKMFLEMPELRPAILSEECRSILHELRGFRHVFRHSYGIEFDKDKIHQLVKRWLSGSELVLQELSGFQSKIQKINSPES